MNRKLLLCGYDTTIFRYRVLGFTRVVPLSVCLVLHKNARRLFYLFILDPSWIPKEKQRNTKFRCGTRKFKNIVVYTQAALYKSR